MFRPVINNQGNFIFKKGISYISYLKMYMTSIQCSRMIRYVLLVPILKKEVGLATTDWHPLSLISVFCLILLSWLTARCLNLDRRYWKLIYAVPMSVGRVILIEPKKTVERMVFMTMLIFFFQSLYIFSAFSTIQLQCIKG